METRHPPNVLIIRNQFRIVYRRLYWILLDEFASTQNVLSATYFHVVVALSQAITPISWWSLLKQLTTPQRNHRMRSDNISSNDRLIRLSNHLHGHYSRWSFVHRHLNNDWYNKAYFLIWKPYLVIIASNWFINVHPEYKNEHFYHQSIRNDLTGESHFLQHCFPTLF